MMTTLNACILKPKGPLHLGQREGMREGTETVIHSDTLFSALCHSFLLLYGRAELERFLAAFGSTPPLLISSAYYHCQDRFYFPVPHNQIPVGKEQKKIRFVMQSEFEKLLAGKALDEETVQAKLPEGVITTDDVPRVTVSRLTGTAAEEGGFYHLGQVWLQNAAFFFLYEVKPEWKEKFEATVRLMCDEGVGGYRTVGKGQFYPPEFRQIELNLPSSADAELLLSLYYPAEGETARLAEGWYQLIFRRGYVYSPDNRSWRRKAVGMFAEGSVFPGGNHRGMLVDVTPDRVLLPHPVYRYGVAFTLPCRFRPERRGE
ncbi:MAG: type III-A CRISPR-associated RAMP protein Csm4 [candidate division WOR-3 bacterium]